MSMAIIAQIESNTSDGGSAQGYLSGTDSSSLSDTFYARRLTTMLINESFSGTPTVNTFTASTGGSGASSTAGTFTLVPGTYRVTVNSIYVTNSSNSTIVVGLYNVTSSAFEVYSGGSEPILGTVSSWVNGIYGSSVIDAKITVASTNKTFQISHKASTQAAARGLTMCGENTAMTGANVNGAAAKNTYCVVKIVRTA